MWYNNLDTQPRKTMTIGKEDTPDLMIWWKTWTLQWRHSDRDGVPNQQPHGCFLNRLITWKKTQKFRVTGLCAGNSPVTGGFPAQRANIAESVSTWWRHHIYPRLESVSFHYRLSATDEKVTDPDSNSLVDILTFYHGSHWCFCDCRCDTKIISQEKYLESWTKR